jgi:hypothetical protein
VLIVTRRVKQPATPSRQHEGSFASSGSPNYRKTKPCQQRSQTWAVFLSNAGEFQPHSASALHMAHNSLGSDLAFFDEKINLCFGSSRLRLMCLNENSPKTQIPNAGDITTPRATPIHPNPFRSDSRSLSPGVGWQL